MHVFLTFFSFFHLPQFDVKVPRALGAQQEQEELQEGSHTGETEEQGPHLIIAQEKV